MVDGPEILGRVTSAKYSPTLDRVIGLAYVPPALSEPGSSINIKIDGGRSHHRHGGDDAVLRSRQRAPEGAAG